MVRPRESQWYRYPSVKLETLAPPEAMAGLQAWSGLLEQASEPSIFLSPEWIRAWWGAYGGGGHEARLWAARDAKGELWGLAPLYVRRVRLAGLVNARVIGVMGDEGVGSEYLGLLVRPGREAEFLSALAEVLAGDWAVLDFHGLPEGGALARLIPEILGARARERIHCERRPCVRVLLPDDCRSVRRCWPTSHSAGFCSTTSTIHLWMCTPLGWRNGFLRPQGRRCGAATSYQWILSLPTAFSRCSGSRPHSADSPGKWSPRKNVQDSRPRDKELRHSVMGPIPGDKPADPNFHWGGRGKICECPYAFRVGKAGRHVARLHR